MLILCPLLFYRNKTKNEIRNLLIFLFFDRKVSEVDHDLHIYIHKYLTYSLWRMILLNCWKTINYTKQYGPQRLFIISLMTMLIAFIILYMAMSHLLVPTTLYDNHFAVLVCGLLLMYPLHKFLHFLPIAHLGAKVKKKIEWKFGIYPIIEIRVHEPIAKILFLVALLMPLFVITALLSLSYLLFEHYVHYITILMAYQIGLSVPDILHASNIIRAPRNAYIEENEDGFEILVTKHQ